MGHRLAENEAREHVYGVCFKTGPPRRTGLELEWLVHDGADGRLPVRPERLEAALAPLAGPGALPAGSRLTREPGGQVELSSLPSTDLAGCVQALRADTRVLSGALALQGLVLAGDGLEPHLDPPRIAQHPRYRAMEAYLDRVGPSGRMMMRATAAVQVNLDAGDETAGVSGYRYRWQLVHRLGPVLIAAFANSPLWRGRPTGWKSTRRAVWERMDPTRTGPVTPSDDPRAAWADYALDAPLLCLRREAPEDWNAPPGLTFRDWTRGADGLRPPALDDLDYHLTTLFPPIRPRGWLELRMIDSQRGEDWAVAASVAATLMDDPVAARAAWEATEPLCPGGAAVPTPEQWSLAARLGPAEPVIGKAVRACFGAAEASLADSGAPAGLRTATARFSRRYAERGRCPADDLLEGIRG
ncbi:ergothioneine biosynthesis glutamate--cysteine ligase EgtA [Streptacidiphilus carbonis]|uniref:ergothioneine biosynthesis glutamate--cysteine ligase EgtA n=1 Tax=Streptacidiphilus carbonis TaxID=105422 RepID=UPI0005AAE562|nr:ergothioneine biosynthesis glutamate--cysteine ligase EgtA [Streptacidiphilus carbonis]